MGFVKGERDEAQLLMQSGKVGTVKEQGGGRWVENYSEET